jgi:hypothetical protein
MLGLRLGSERWPRTLSAKHSCRLMSRKGPRNLGTADFQDHGRSPHGSPHGLYRALILTHGERL